MINRLREQARSHIGFVLTLEFRATKKGPPISGAFVVQRFDLHVRVSRAARAFRRHPGDVLCRVLDVAGLAVNAVLGVDLEALLAVFLGHHFIHAGRAVTLGRFIVHRQVLGDRNARVGQLQVARLLFFVVGTRDEHRAEFVEADLAVRFRVVDLLAVGRQFQASVIRLGVVQGERQFAAEDVLVEPVEAAADDGAELVNRRAEVAAGEQFVIEPALLEGVDVSGQFFGAVLFQQTARRPRRQRRACRTSSRCGCL